MPATKHETRPVAAGRVTKQRQPKGLTVNTQPAMNIPLLSGMADLSDMARSFVLADVTVWVAEHGALSADDLARFIDEAKAIA